MLARTKTILIWAVGIVVGLNSFDGAAKTKDYVVFSGKITNAVDNEVLLYIHDTKIVVKLGNDGRFQDTLALVSGYYRYIDGAKNRLKIYVEEGKDLHMAYDAKDVKGTIQFSGEGAPTNNYLLRKEELKIQIGRSAMTDSMSTLFQLEEPLFRKVYLKIKNASLQELSSSEGISDPYKEMEERNIQYEYLYGLHQYVSFHRQILNKPDFKVSESFAEEFKPIDYANKQDFLFSEAYCHLVQAHYTQKSKERVAAQKIEMDIATLKELATIEDTFIKDSLLFKFATTYISYSKDLDGFYRTFMAGSTNERHKSIVSKSYETIKSTATGSLSPKFVDYESFAGGTHSLDDFKGSYVFIDIWATWCGPCIYEFPYLDKIKKAYQGKNIRFIALSIDKKSHREKWQNFIREKKLEGIQLLADNAFESKFIKAYNISGIPRFLIIDPHGNIVMNNAPRPSDPKLKEVLDSLPL